MELIIGEHQSGDWFLTSKWQIYDLQDRIIGSLGISRHLHKKEETELPLRELRASIGTIALETGFADHSHLTVSFTRKSGVTPRSERRRRPRNQFA